MRKRLEELSDLRDSCYVFEAVSKEWKSYQQSSSQPNQYQHQLDELTAQMNTKRVLCEQKEEGLQQELASMRKRQNDKQMKLIQLEADIKKKEDRITILQMTIKDVQGILFYLNSNYSSYF